MSISVAAARSRDQTNLEIMASCNGRRSCLPSSVELEPASTIPNRVPTTTTLQEALLPTQSTLSSTPPLSGADQSISVRHMLSLATWKLVEHLKRLSALLSRSDICAPCWVHKQECAHQLNKCKGIGLGYLQVGSKHKAWKGSFNLPKGQCFRCCLPQVSAIAYWSQYWQHILRKFFQIRGVHENNSAGHSCNNIDFIRPLAFSIWDSSLLQAQVLEEFGIKSKITKLSEFTSWLKQETPGHKGILNLHLAVMLEYFKQSTLEL